MMRAGHQAAAAPCALAVGVYTDAPVLVRLGCAGLVLVSCTFPDLDHQRFSKRIHPGAALVRVYARQVYRLHTSRDEKTWRQRKRKIIAYGEKYNPRNVHRGPSHCIETAILAGYLFAIVAGRFPPLTDHRWWVGLAVTVGWTSHLLADALTPTGVTLSAIVNFALYREVWRRQVIGWRLFYPGTWWLRWVRMPVMFNVDEKDDEYRPGIFRTNHGGEHMMFIPVMWGITGVSALIIVGLFNPAMSIITGNAM